MGLSEIDPIKVAKVINKTYNKCWKRIGPSRELGVHYKRMKEDPLASHKSNNRIS